MAIAESHSGGNTHRSSRHDSGMDETHDQSGFDHLRKYVSASTISSPASHNYIYCKIATRCNCCTTARGRNQLIYRCRRRKQTGDCNFSACSALVCCANFAYLLSNSCTDVDQQTLHTLATEKSFHLCTTEAKQNSCRNRK